MTWPSSGLTPALPLKRALVALTATGDVVAAVAGKRIKVYQYEVQSESAGMTVQFRDGAAGSFLGVPWKFDAREGAIGSSGTNHPSAPLYLFATTAGNALRAAITGTGTVNIAVSYWDEDAA